MKSLILGVLMVGLIGCGGNDVEPQTSAALLEIKSQRLAREWVEANLKDADSAQFQNQSGFCGEVNAKNSFGAYTGFKRFMATSETLVITEGAMPNDEFVALWSAYCK